MSGSQDARIANSAFGTGKRPLTTEKHVKKTGFTTLHDGGKNPTVDIVFVHGLQGHPAKTWTFGDFRGPDDEHYESIKDPFASSDPGRLRSLFNRKKKSPAASERGQPGLFWPETLLKDHEHCQTARVMTYGYNSEIIRLGAPVNWNTISDHGESLLIGLANERSESPDRPLMFLVHSLGGLIVKSALIDSAAGKKEDLRAVSRATFAIIFFGTPHRGSAYASMGTTISKIAHLATGKPVNTSVVNSLNRNTEILTKLRKNFLLLLENIVKENGYESSTFQESIPYSKGIPALDGKIVDDDSSEMGHSCDRNNHIERNHMDMCKFSGPEDSEYQKVSGEIKRHIIRLQGMIIQERRICLNSLDNPELDLQHLPVSRATESTLKWILSSNDQSGTGLARWLQNGSGVFWINGRPGSGKSTAMRYLVEHDKTKELVECKGAKWDIIASFFIDRGSKSQRSGESILRHILFQLLKARPPLIDQVLRFTKRKDVIVPEKSLSKLDETTEEPVYEWDERSVKKALLYCKGQNKTPFRSCIFLDGLDEHEGDHNEFGRFILSLASRTDETELNTIKICVASRPEQVFNDLFQKTPNFAMQDYTYSDIRKHLTKRLGEHPRLTAFDTEQNHQMTRMYEYVVENSHGVFLWVESVAAEIYRGLDNGESITSLWELLRGLPTNMEELYKQILQKIEPGLRLRAYYMLEIVLRARKPLTLVQLALIAHIAQQENTNQQSWSGTDREVAAFNDAQAMSRQLLTSCRCILEWRPQVPRLDRYRSWTFSSIDSDDLEYSFEPRRRFIGMLDDDSDYSNTDVAVEDTHVAEDDVQHLPSNTVSRTESLIGTPPSIERQSTDSTEAKTSRRSDSWAIEAMEYQQSRAYDGQRNADPATDHIRLLHRSVKEFLLGEGSLELLFPKGIDKPNGTRKPEGNGHLYILIFSRAWLKLRATLRHQLRCIWDVGLEVPYHARQLEITLPRGDLGAMKLLERRFAILEEVDIEASIKSPRRSQWPEEWFTAHTGNSIPHWVFTFPAFAVSVGMMSYIRYLLDKSHDSAERLLKSKEGRPLLHFAIYSTGEVPQPDMVRLLLRYGANVDAKFEEKTAIQSLFIQECDENGEPHLSVITALLEGGADSDSHYYPTIDVNAHGWHPLLHVVGYANQIISLNIRLKLLQTLIQHGVDLNAKDGFGRTFLEVLYWNDKRLPAASWQDMLEKGAKITRAMITRNDLYCQTDTDPTIFGHFWRSHFHPHPTQAGFAAFNGALISTAPQEGGQCDNEHGIEDEKDRNLDGNQKELGRDGEYTGEDNYFRDYGDKVDEREEDRDEEDEFEGLEYEEDKGTSSENEDENDYDGQALAVHRYARTAFYFSNRARFENFIHLPIEARTSSGPLFQWHCFKRYYEDPNEFGEWMKEFYGARMEEHAGDRNIEVCDIGVLDECGRSGAPQDAYKVLRQRIFRKEKYYTPEAVKRVLEIDPEWFVERIAPEPQGLLHKAKRMVRLFGS